jgi:hypothetical protein
VRGADQRIDHAEGSGVVADFQQQLDRIEAEAIRRHRARVKRSLVLLLLVRVRN